MRFNKLDLNLLVALDAMLTTCSISRAAERLHMSQSAMSSALGRLRDYFGDELLVPVGRRMERTPRGEMLQGAVHDLLLRVDSTIAAQPEFVPSQSDREFRLSVSDYSMATLMPLVMARWQAQSASVRVVLVPQVEEPQRAIERGEVDLLIMPSAYCADGHPTEPVLSETFTCVLWRDSALAAGELTLEQYAAARHVEMRPPGSQRPSYEAWFLEREGLSRHVAVTSYSFSMTPQLIVGTDLIATLHTRLARQAAATLPVVLRPPPVAIPAMRLDMQWHQYRGNDPGIAWLRKSIAQAALDLDSLASAAPAAHPAESAHG